MNPAISFILGKPLNTEIRFYYNSSIPENFHLFKHESFDEVTIITNKEVIQKGLKCCSKCHDSYHRYRSKTETCNIL